MRKLQTLLFLLLLPVFSQSQEVTYLINGIEKYEFDANSDKINTISVKVLLPEVASKCDKLEFRFCKAGYADSDISSTFRYRTKTDNLGRDTFQLNLLRAVKSKFDYPKKGDYVSDFPNVNWSTISENRQEFATFSIKVIGYKEEGTKEVWKHKHGCSGCSRSCDGQMETVKYYGEGSLLSYKNRLNVFQDSSYRAQERAIIHEHQRTQKQKMKKVKRRRFLSSFIYGTVGLGAAALIIRWIRNSN